MTLKHLMKEPISTLTNLAYPVACWLVIAQLDVLGGFLLLSGVGMGVGSALFHSRRKRKFQALDEINMYTLLMAVMAYNTGIAILPAGIIAAGIWLWYHHDLVSSSRAVPTLGLAALVTTGLLGSWIHAGLALLIFFASYVLRQWGEASLEASGKSYNLKYDVLHGVWHIGTGATIFFLIV